MEKMPKIVKKRIEDIHKLLVKANEIEDKELRKEAIEAIWSLLMVILDSMKTMP